MTTRRGHHEGTVRQRPDGTWEARLSLPGGKRKSVYAKTRREVQDKLRTAQRDIDSGLDLSAGRRTVAQYLDDWLARVKPAVKPKTWEGYESIVRVRVRPHLGHVPLSRLTPLDVQKLYATLEDAGLSRRSVHHTHCVLHRAFRQAMRWQLLPRNPCDGATPPTPVRRDMRVLSASEVTHLLDATRAHPSHGLYVLAVTSGARIGELLALRWDDLDLDAGKLAVRRSLQRQRGAGLVFVHPKTDRSRRTVHLSQRAISALREHRTRQLEHRLAIGAAWHDQGLVFANATGGPLDPSWQTNAFKATLRAAGLPVVRFHDLRHTAATLLLGQGVHPKVVSEMLGHATITLTLDTYSHFVPALHAQAAAAMDAALSA